MKHSIPKTPSKKSEAIKLIENISEIDLSEYTPSDPEVYKYFKHIIGVAYRTRKGWEKIK